MTATGQSTRTMSVFIVEEEELVRRGLIDLLTSYEDIAVVGTADSVGEALGQIARSRPELVLLDARLPEGAGITACRALRAAHPELRCLVLASFDDDEALLAAVLSGAAGYLVKQIGGSGLVEGVRRVAQGQSLLDVAGTEDLLDRLRQASQGEPGSTSLLTEERRVLDLVAQGSTDPEIVAALSLPIEEVERIVSSIFVKLGPRGRMANPLLGAGRWAPGLSRLDGPVD